MTESCVSELTIDSMLADVLSPDEAARVRDHARSCRACGGLLADAEAVKQRFAAAPPPLRLGLRRPRAIAAAVAALAAAGILVVAWPRDTGVVMTKGGPTVAFYISHDGELRRGQSGDRVAPGDRLQLVTSSSEPTWIAVSGVDANGTRTIYAQPAPLPTGPEAPLPFSIILDEVLGPSTITAVFCPHPFALDHVPADCTTDAVELETR